MLPYTDLWENAFLSFTLQQQRPQLCKNALDRLVELNLLHFNPQEVQHIKDVIDLRNRVHIRLTNGNELSNADFNRDIYNDAVNLLKTVDEQIYQYAVPLYGCGHTIPISREP